MKLTTHTEKYLGIIQNLIDAGAHRVVVALSEKRVIRATRRIYKAYGKRPTRVDEIELNLFEGRPNAVEREWIKRNRKLNTAFPFRRVFLMPEKPKAKRKGRR